MTEWLSVQYEAIFKDFWSGSYFHVLEKPNFIRWASVYSRGCFSVFPTTSFLMRWETQLICCQSLSRVWLFVTPWTAAHQASLSITNSRNLLKLMSIESVIPSNYLILCRPLLLLPSIFLSIRVFSMSQFFACGGQSIGVSASASVLPMNTQDWSPLGWTRWISLQSKGLSRVFSNATVQKHQSFSTQLYHPTLISVHDYWKNHSFD